MQERLEYREEWELRMLICILSLSYWFILTLDNFNIYH